MGLPEIIKLDKTKCQHCLACLLVCPVKLSNIVEPDGISVNPDLCIGCGECIRACREKGHHARSGVDDFDDFLPEVEAGVPMGVLVAPAAAVNYGADLPKMITALRNLGVKYVFDVSFGAEIGTYNYLKLVKSGTPKPIIAQPCPAVVNFIEIYHPDLIPYLAPTHSPALAAAQWVLSQPRYKGLKLAFLGPCFAKRREIHDPNTKGVVSYNITYKSLDNYFQAKGITLAGLAPSGFDTPEAERAVVFSQPGGLTETFRRFGIPFRKSDVPRIEGPQEVYLKYLPQLGDDITGGTAPLLVDILNCQHGCNIGPAVTHQHTHYQVDLIMDNRREAQIKKHNSSEGPNPDLFEDYYKWIDSENIDFSRNYTDRSADTLLTEPTAEEEELTWTRLHKLTPDERQINCASCGYGNCRSMMMAIVNRLNHVESCKYYLFKENELNLLKVEAQAAELQKSRDEVAAWNEVLEKTVAQRTAAVRNLLNNAGQGFLTFGEDLLVNDEYSSECRRVFGGEIGGLKFSQLIYPDDEGAQMFLDSLISEVFGQDDQESMVDIYLSLLPSEVEFGDMHLKLEYKTISSTDSTKHCMAIITDVTEKRLLETQMELERNNLKMIVRVLVNYNDFIQTLKEYNHFCGALMHQIIEADYPLEQKISEIFRHVHTFKGNFSQFYMTVITQRLHELESQISAVSKKLASNTEHSYLGQFMQGFDLDSWLKEDMERLEDVLGPDFIAREDVLEISKAKLIEIEKKVESILPPAECRILITEIRKLRYRPFDALLNSYQDYVQKLAEQVEKSLHPVVVEGERVLVDPERYSNFVRSLVHVFRNAVDHGIETAEERIESGKADYGRIKCFISSQGNQINLVIADDGRGIDCQKLRDKVAGLGLLTPEEAAGISNEGILDYLFADAVSTTDTVNDLSGRGIGLGAVRGEAEKLGGVVKVKTFPGRGTEFRFTIPMEDDGVWGISVSEIINPIVDTTTDFLVNHIGLAVNSVDVFDLISTEKLLLHKYTAFIAIKGALDVLFVLSMEEPVLKRVLKNFIFEELTEEEEQEYMEDVLTESTNNILGNSLKFFPGLNEMIVFDSPVSISSSDALMKYQESTISSGNIQTDAGKLSLSLVLPRKAENTVS